MSTNIKLGFIMGCLLVALGVLGDGSPPNLQDNQQQAQQK